MSVTVKTMWSTNCHYLNVIKTLNNKTLRVMSKLHYWGTECNLYDSLLETKGPKLSCQVLPELFPQSS
jgi:hypothetical protein